jgi:hypothetical protein
MKRISHKACLLSAVMLLLLLTPPITALADGGDDEFTQTVDGYRVTLVFEKPIASGANQIHIQVSDTHGQAVSHAQVEVSFVEAKAEHADAEESTLQSDTQGVESMSEGGHTETTAPTPESDMHGMEGTNEIATSATTLPDGHNEMGMVAFAAGHEAGEYEGEIVVTGAGEWTIRVHLTVENRLIEFDFPLHVAGSQAGSKILLGFFAINAVILGTAATLKLKPATA